MIRDEVIDLTRTMIISPRRWGIDHDDFRKHQYETYEWIRRQSAHHLLLEAPTGSGKTVWPTMLGHDGKTVALVHTKSLEQQYSEYGAFDLYGRSNYPCVHPDHRAKNVSQCPYKYMGMKKCAYYTECEYIVARSGFHSAQYSTTNYAYWIASRQGYLDGTLVLDECHLLPDIIMDVAGLEMSDRTRRRFGFPDFPLVSGLVNTSPSKHDNPIQLVLDWLTKCIAKIEDLKDNKKMSSAADDIKGKIDLTYEAISSTPPGGWHVESNRRGFFARPYSAKGHFENYFKAKRIVLMSATIGDIDLFSREELGLDDYAGCVVPSVWPAEVRPIYALDAPKIGYKSTESDKLIQVQCIADAIKKMADPSWTGIIHTVKKVDAPRIANQLQKMGIDAVATPQMSTQQQINWWEENRRPGRYVVAWSWHAGVDAGDEEVCIITKIPFSPIGSDYERKKMYSNGRVYNARAARTLEQMAGRTRRGRPEDYDIGKRNSLVAIADGNWRRVRKYMSDSFRESIVELK